MSGENPPFANKALLEMILVVIEQDLKNQKLSNLPLIQLFIFCTPFRSTIYPYWGCQGSKGSGLWCNST